jgi:L-lactate dehydrogenase complex protein LldG
MNARETILSRLRAGLSRSDLRFPPPETMNLSERMEVTHQDGDAWDLADRFRRELSAIHGSAEVLETPVAARMAVIAQIGAWVVEDQAERRTQNPVRASDREILCWEPQRLPVPGLEESLTDLGYQLIAPKDLSKGPERERIREIRAGITGVDAAFATTGSFLVGGGQGRSRAASLTPLRHLALIPFSRLFPNAERWMAMHRRAGTLVDYLHQSANVSLITGPSKSADIAGSLTLGVHGPKVLHAILFDDRDGGEV